MWGIALKGSADLFSANGDIAVRFGSDGIGGVFQAVASIFSGKLTIQFTLGGYEFEIGGAVHAGAIGVEYVRGTFDDKGKQGGKPIIGSGVSPIWRFDPPNR